MLLTGCTGFIGSNLALRFVERGDEIYALVRHTTKRDFTILGKAVERIRFIEGDLADYHSLESAIESSSPHVVVHLAAMSPVRLSFEDPFPYIRANFVGTCNLIHAILKRAPSARLVAATSAEVYGWQAREPVKENARLCPSSPYGVSKAAADEYIQMAMRVYGLRATVLRCNNTYGRKEDSKFFIEYAISSMLRGEPVYVGTPGHIRDYMYVDDHLNAYLLAMENNDAVGNVFNVSPGNPISNIEVIKRIAKILGFTKEVVTGSYPPGYPMRPGRVDTDYIVLDSSNIRARLGWKPTVTLDEGLKRTIELWKKVAD